MEFNKENCTINLEHDNNYQCDVVVYKPLQVIANKFILSNQKCDKGTICNESHEYYFVIF